MSAMSEAQWEERALKAEARVALLESESDDMAFALAELRKRLPASSGGGGGLSTPEPSSSSHEQACDGYSPMVVHGDVGHQLHASCAVVVVERACASSNCLAVALRPRVEMFAVGGADGSVRLWRDAGGAAVSSVACGSPPIAVAWEPTLGTRLCCGGMDGALSVLDVVHDDESGEAALRKVAAFRDHDKPLVGTAWASDGRSLATCARDGSVVLYRCDGPGGTQLSKRHTLALPSNPECLVFVSNETLAVCARGEAFIRYIDLETLTESRVSKNTNLFDTHNSFDVLHLSLSPDHKFLVAATDKNKHVVYPVQSNAHARVLVGHNADEYANPRTAWLDGGGVVVSNSSGDDHSLHQWCFASGKPLDTVTGAHRGQVRSLDALENRVATASFDKTVKLWRPAKQGAAAQVV